MKKNLRKLLLLLCILSTVLNAAGIEAIASSTATISITTQPSSAVVYAGGTATLTVAATSSATLKYQWYSNTKNSTSSSSVVSGATSSSYSPSTKSTGTKYYYCLVYTSGTSVVSSKSSIVSVTVKALPKITTQPSSITAYVGNTSTLSVKATGGGTLTYQWYSNTKNSTTGIDEISGATGSSYSPPTDTVGITYYCCVVTNTDSAMTATKTAAVTSSLAAVNVKEVNATAPTITSQPSSITVYSGSTTKLTVAAIGSGALSYQWYSNSTNTTSGSTAVSGATSASYSAPIGAAGTTYYYCIVTNTVSSAAYTTTSSIVTCKVKASTAITAQPVDATVYTGNTVTLSLTATGSSTLTYQWYSNTGSSTTGGSKISGATSSSYSPSTTTTGTTYYYCVVTNTDSSMTDDETSTATSSAAKVVVYVEKATAPTITTQPSSAVGYVGSTMTLTVVATGSGTLTYQWYSNSESSTSTGTEISGATEAKYTAPTTTGATLYYYCVVKNTVVTASGTESLTTVSSAASVTVKTLPAITTQPSGATTYVGDTITLSVVATGTATLSYQWYSSSKNSATGGAKISGATKGSYDLKAKTAGTIYYYCIVTNTDSAITGTKTATVTSSVATVIINASVASAPKITKKPVNASVLVGDTASLSITATGSGTLSYQWYSNSKNTASGGAAISGATGAAYSVPTTTEGTTYYYCVVTNTDSAMSKVQTASTTSGIAWVTVKSLSPTIKKQPVSSSVYKGSSLILTITATGGGTLTYQWYTNSVNSSSSGTAITDATGAKYSAATTSEGTKYYYCIVTNTVKKTSETLTGTAVSSVAAVVVAAAPTITTQPTGTTINSGGSFTLTVAATGGGTLSYQWYSNTKDKNSGGKKINAATSEAYKCTTAASSATTTTYYYCVVKSVDSTISGGKAATATSSTAAVTVKASNAAAPQITTNISNQTVTVGKSATMTIVATGSGTLSYQWYSNTKNSTKGAAAISGATASAYTVTPTAAGAVYYYCVVTNTDSTVSGTKTASTVSKIVKVTAKA